MAVSIFSSNFWQKKNDFFVNMCILVPITSNRGSCCCPVLNVWVVPALWYCSGVLILWDVSYALRVQYSLWFSFHYSTTLQCGSALERFVMNRAFILLSSTSLAYLLSAAARTVSLCLALSWALQTFRCISSGARTWHWSVHYSVVEPAYLPLVFFKLVSSHGFYWRYSLWLTWLSL